MRRAALAAFPSLLAAYPTLSLAAGSAAEFSPWELALLLLLVLLAAALLHLGVYALLRGRARPAAVSLVAAALVGWIFCSNLLLDRVAEPLARTPLRVAIPAGVAAAAWWAVRSRANPVGLARFCAVFTAALVLFPTAALARELYRFSAGPVVEGGAGPAAAFARSGAAAAARGRPDVYLIVLDQYGDSGVLRDQLGFSNRAFEDSLRAMGFTIPRVSRSNYAWTAQSLASMLNMEHLPVLARGVDPEERSNHHLYRLVHGNRVSRVLKEHGYRVYFQPGLRWWGTGRNDAADSVYGVPSGIRGLLARSALGPYVLATTVPGRLLHRAGFRSPVDAANVEALRSVPEVAPRPGPKFVFLHSMIAHPPYRFDASCGEGARSTAEREYVEQIRCANRLLLATVGEILRRSPEPPVILLQADHGPRLPRNEPAGDGPLTPAQVQDRFGAFAAYHLPGGGADALPDTVTPVNLFRIVLNRYLGAGLPLRADDMYYSRAHGMYRFARVPPEGAR
ncbi:MAG: hypothetical protein AB1941_02425 [Gemmatimonadota bacterium]